MSSSGTVSGKLRYRFVNWEGETIAESERVVSVPSVVDLRAPRISPGSRFLEAVIDLDVPGQAVPGVRPCWVMRPRAEPGKLAQAGVDLRNGGPDLARVVRAAREAGVKWTREDLEWRVIEPKPGDFRWALFDAVARREGISISTIASGFPAWVEPYSPQRLMAIAASSRRPSRYKGDVHHGEIWNEPNIFFWQGPKEM